MREHDEHQDSNEIHPVGADVAVVGMAGRFPGAPELDQYWANLRSGVESVTFFTDEELLARGVDPALLQDPNYVRAGVVLEEAESFDGPFFGYFPREVEVMDPQQRMFLECSWQALESSGISAEVSPSRIGVFGGVTMNTYLSSNLLAHGDLLGSVGHLQAMLGNDKDFTTARVAYHLDLRGPSYTVQTACCTSLVAVHLACRSLLSGECDVALAGGASFRPPQGVGYLYQEGGTSSRDGHCRAFDAGATGALAGSGVGIVVLQRLEDALAERSTVHAVVKGSAVTNDGRQKAGISAPSVDGQTRAVEEALALAGVDAESIGFVEAHGTGTRVGDPIEFEALTRAFRARTREVGFCTLGSVKPNIGHLDAAAGIAGFLKTVLALRHGELPPTLHFQKPNPDIDLESSPFRVSAQLQPWPQGQGPRRAGVNSVGMGGTNCHMILEQGPELPPVEATTPCPPIVLSAKTRTALDAQCRRLADHWEQQPDLQLGDVAHTLLEGRARLPHRRAVLAGDREGVLRGLRESDRGGVLHRSEELVDRSVVFLFPGQGTQYPAMAGELYRQEPLFRDVVDRSCELLKPHLDLDLRTLLWPQEEDPAAAETLRQTALTQPALFVVEYALASLWQSWGVKPWAMVGHSIGEWVAACLAEVVTLEDALALVAERGRLMQEAQPGSMLSVASSPESIEPYLEGGLALAAVNSAEQCSVAGPDAEIAGLEKRLLEEGIVASRLHTSHAFHSPSMAGAAEAFVAAVAKVDLQPPRVPFLSNLTGEWIRDEEATSPAYWGRHLERTVRFGPALELLHRERPEALWLEVGPGRTLGALATMASDPHPGELILPSLPAATEERTDGELFQEAMARLWLLGVPIGPPADASSRRQRIALPVYPFERRRYWVEPKPGGRAAASPAEPAPVAAAGHGSGRLHITAEALAGAFSQALQALGGDEVVISLGSGGAPAPAGPRATPPAPRPAAPPAAPAHGVAPEVPVEGRILEIWKDLLGIAEIGPEESFFELGGNSLLATQLLSRLRQELRAEVSMKDLFDNPTVRQQAALLEPKPEPRKVEESEERPAEGTADQILQDIQGLSQEEVQAALADELHPRPDLVTAYEPPGYPLEQEVAELWAELLGLAEVGVHDNFYELGGHSLLVPHLLTRVRLRFGVELTREDLLAFPSVAGVSLLIAEHTLGAEAGSGAEPSAGANGSSAAERLAEVLAEEESTREENPDGGA